MDNSMDLESELISLISQLLFLTTTIGYSYRLVFWLRDMKARSLITKIISLVSLMDLNSQPKPESELMSLITQSLSVFNSLDLDSLSTRVSKFISELSREIYMDSDSDERDLLFSLFGDIMNLEPEPELFNLTHKIFSLVISVNSKSRKFISLCPQAEVRLQNGKFHVVESRSRSRSRSLSPSWSKWVCFLGNWVKCKFTGENTTFFFCDGCYGKNHKEYKQAPVEIKHHLHRQHSLQLVMLSQFSRTRECYCCEEDLLKVFYYCSACDLGMNIACARKPPVLHIDHPEWHEHSLALFPRHASLTCNLCGLADESSPIYMCPPCDCVIHRKCVNLPRLIRISRHPHRISFTPSFHHENHLSCGVCRKNISSNFGGYFCIKDDCSYAAHSKCATQSNVWDGNELEGEPEEDIAETKPFVRISDGIIQHFSHQHHHLRLDENTGRDYDENKECQACITPIYFGNFYSCMQCDFILHQECANLSRRIYHPIHPHLLTLKDNNVVEHISRFCSACERLCTAGFFYECGKEGCYFEINVQCATVSEPLVRESHMHSLFLTSKPEEETCCSVCEEKSETFNCLECDFALCFGCATLPEKVRYKHDKHALTLSYEKKTSTMTAYWCEVCEGGLNSEKGFYMCDNYCCVTIHIQCLLGRDLYMKPGSSWFEFGKSEKKVHVLPNNHHLTRPICSYCEKRCPHKIAFKWSGSILCSFICVLYLSTKKSRELDGHSQ